MFDEFTTEELTAMEPCLIHEAVERQKNAVFVSRRLNPGRKPRYGKNAAITDKDLILGIYHENGRGDHVAEKYKVSRDVVYRIWRGDAYPEVTGHVKGA
ncbi:MAG: hypothetical protein ACPG6R_11820 [Aequoribacter sp.]|uniref:hypothetical protein n=1 Tax=Aequoribacter sp. TaxID=2847771 RepID=UPI003C3A3704